MKLAEISIKRPSLVIVLFTILTLGGLFSYSNLGYELIPKFETNVITIATIYPGASPSEIEITNNTSNDLKAGMYGTAKFASNQQKQTLKIVPRNAFVGSVSSNEIFVIENGTAKLKKVTAGRILGDKVEILDGLSNGEIVIVTGQINLQDGNAVEIIK